MKMIGMSIRSAAMRFCRSRPLSPGRGTSRMMQIEAAHPGHCDVEDQTLGLAHEIRCEELLRRREGLRSEAELPEQIWKRLAHRFVVIDDRYKRPDDHNDENENVSRAGGRPSYFGVGRCPPPACSAYIPDGHAHER